jgi:hypothetical protein
VSNLTTDREAGYSRNGALELQHRQSCPDQIGQFGTRDISREVQDTRSIAPAPRAVHRKLPSRLAVLRSTRAIKQNGKLREVTTKCSSSSVAPMVLRDTCTVLRSPLVGKKPPIQRAAGTHWAKAFPVAESKATSGQLFGVCMCAECVQDRPRFSCHGSSNR